MDTCSNKLFSHYDDTMTSKNIDHSTWITLYKSPTQ